jgi:4-hydroxy-3-methylbut-2-enyl diphosphate reductase
MELAESVDLVVVVGGRSSANTAELTRLCRMAGKPVIQIETPHDIADGSAFDGVRVVGITGGTSTPIEDLEAVAVWVYEVAGTAERRAHAEDLARQALVSVAEPAYRSTSIGRSDRAVPVVTTSGVA